MFAFNNFVVAGKFFLVIAGELILIFVAVSFIIGLLMEYLPPSRIRDFLSNKFTWLQYFLGSGLGALTPFCSCSTVPITAGLLKGGVPFGPTMAFLFSSPVLNPVIIALLLPLFGLKITMAYIVITFLGSMATAAILSRTGMENQVKPLIALDTACCGQGAKSAAVPETVPGGGCCSAEQAKPSPFVILQAAPKASAGCCASPSVSGSSKPVQSTCCSVDFERTSEETVPFGEKMKRASLSAVDTFKGVFWYLLLGAGIGAFIYGFFPQDLVVRLAGPENPWSIPVAAAIGVPMYIRAETIIPISAALVGKGMGAGTVLALIIGGAGASIPELILLGSMFKRKLVVAFAVNVFIIAILAGYLVDLFVY